MSPLTLLAPAHQLPTEGSDAPAFDAPETASSGDLVRYFATLVAGQSASFSVSDEGDVAAVYGNHPFELVCLQLAPGADQPEPTIDLTPTSTRVYLGTAADEIEAFDADDGVRQLIEHIGHRVADATRGLGGTPVPLVRWEPAEHTLHFIGAWLADDETVASLRDGETGDGLSVVLEEAEVEGHGLRETVAALAVLGLSLTPGGAQDNGDTPASKTPPAASLNPLANLELLTAAVADLIIPEPGDTPAPAAVEVSYESVDVRAPGQEPALIDRDGLDAVDPANTHVIVDVAAQRAYLLDGSGHILIDTPVSTARRGKVTPRGEFTITQRVRTGKRSTIYGCALPYWMRLDQSAIGLHVGDLPGYPASAGCVRLPKQIAPVLYDHTVSGSTVQVLNSWQKPATATLLASAK